MSTGIVANAGALFFTAVSRSTATSLLRIRKFVVALRHRQELRCLLESDDHRLADIGISRDDLHSALSEPFWRDPTTAFATGGGRPAADRRRVSGRARQGCQ
jgi:uncharacterized protein YjiS (DUF1127 family)